MLETKSYLLPTTLSCHHCFCYLTNFTTNVAKSNIKIGILGESDLSKPRSLTPTEEDKGNKKVFYIFRINRLTLSRSEMTGKKRKQLSL